MNKHTPATTPNELLPLQTFGEWYKNNKQYFEYSEIVVKVFRTPSFATQDICIDCNFTLGDEIATSLFTNFYIKKIKLAKVDDNFQKLCFLLWPTDPNRPKENN